VNRWRKNTARLGWPECSSTDYSPSSVQTLRMARPLSFENQRSFGDRIGLGLKKPTSERAPSVLGIRDHSAGPQLPLNFPCAVIGLSNLWITIEQPRRPAGHGCTPRATARSRAPNPSQYQRGDKVGTAPGNFGMIAPSPAVRGQIVSPCPVIEQLCEIDLATRRVANGIMQLKVLRCLCPSWVSVV
jgi:hypothetical protein